MKYALTIILLVWTSFAYGQTTKRTVDTVNIYKHKTGVRFGLYKKVWFPRNGSWSYSHSKMNKQDSLVLLDTVGLYLKVYGRRDRLIFEGQHYIYDSGLTGDIKFYRRNGKLKKIEHWEQAQYKDTVTNRIFREDGNALTKTKHYRRDGSIKKSFEHIIKINSLTPLSYCFIRQTIMYKKNEQTKFLKQKKDKCYTDK